MAGCDAYEPVREGGYAFPGQMNTGFDPRSGNFHQGMTLRDYFAGQVLAGACSNHFVSEEQFAVLARNVYRMADAMLIEREKLSKEAAHDR